MKHCNINSIKDENHLYNIDIIKIIATFGILFHHYQQFYGQTFYGINFYGGKFVFGYFVELFFMVSGFLVVYTEKGENDLCNLSRKYLRFLPSVFLAGITFLLIHYADIAAFGHDLDGRSYSFFNVATSLFLFCSGWFVEYSPAVNNPVWYLSILILCYMIYFLFQFLCARFHISMTPILVIFVMFSTVVNWRNIRFPFFWFSNVRGYVPFFTGVVLHSVYKKGTLFWIRVISCFCLTGYAACSMIKGISWWYSLVFLLYPAILLLSITSKQVDCKPLSLLGGYRLMCISGIVVCSG